MLQLVAAVLLVVWAPLPFLLVVGLGFVLVLLRRFLSHPDWELVLVSLLTLLAFTLIVITLALVIIVGLPLFLELLDGGFQGHYLL